MWFHRSAIAVMVGGLEPCILENRGTGAQQVPWERSATLSQSLG